MLSPCFFAGYDVPMAGMAENRRRLRDCCHVDSHEFGPRWTGMDPGWTELDSSWTGMDPIWTDLDSVWTCLDSTFIISSIVIWSSFLVRHSSFRHSSLLSFPPAV